VHARGLLQGQRARVLRASVQAAAARVEEWFAGLGEAQEDGMPCDDAMKLLVEEGLGAALSAWHEKMEASLPARA
jgi:hypothetical protein